jgi:hypothetical protein
MKAIKVSVNKSEDNREGLEIQVVDPENELEQKTLAHLLLSYVRDAVARGTFKVDLPDDFTIQYQREGSFIMLSGPTSPDITGPSPTYYSPGKPIAVLAIQNAGDRFDVVYGEISADKAPADGTTPTPQEPANA